MNENIETIVRKFKRAGYTSVWMTDNNIEDIVKTTILACLEQVEAVYNEDNVPGLDELPCTVEDGIKMGADRSRVYIKRQFGL